jgi:hypothetical protein
MSRLIALLLALTLAGSAVGATACGSSTKTVAETSADGQVTSETVPSVHFAKTKFLVHMGLAFGAFHRYVYKPFRAGAFRSGAPGRIKAFAKAGAAGLLAAHELKVANEDALSDDHLRPLATKVDALVSKLGSLGGALKGGSLNPSSIAAAAGAVTALGSASSGLGAGIKEVAPSLGG